MGALTRLPEKVAAAAVEFIYRPVAENHGRVGKVLRRELEGPYSARRGDFRIGCQISGVVTIVAMDHQPTSTGAAEQPDRVRQPVGRLLLTLRPHGSLANRSGSSSSLLGEPNRVGCGSMQMGRAPVGPRRNGPPSRLRAR